MTSDNYVIFLTHTPGVLIRLFHITIQSFQIKIYLPGMLRLELSDFQLDRHETGQGAVVKQQIDIKILPAHLNAVFLADKGEILSEFQNELL